MIEIFKTTNPEIIRYLYPHLNEDEEYDKKIITEEIFSHMVHRADSTCVIVCFDEDTLVGFTLGWLVDNRSYAWSAQSYLRKDVERSVSKEAWTLFEDWVYEKGYDKIRFETNRNPDVINRVYGTTTHCYVMQKEL